MNSSLNLSQPLTDLPIDQLIKALEEASEFPNKRVYQTDAGVQALSDGEAKTTVNAHMIGLCKLSRIADSNFKEIRPEVQLGYSKALRVSNCSIKSI